MKKMIATWIILIISLIGLLTVIGYNFSKKNELFKNYEEELIEATDIYVTNNKINVLLNDVNKYSLNELIFDNEELLDFSYKNNCIGYVKVFNNNGSYNYKPYISCDKYETKGYIK